MHLLYGHRSICLLGEIPSIIVFKFRSVSAGVGKRAAMLKVRFIGISGNNLFLIACDVRGRLLNYPKQIAMGSYIFMSLIELTFYNVPCGIAAPNEFAMTVEF